MPNVKTAISLPEALFVETDTTARRLGTSRSRIIVLALEDFLRRRKNQELLEQINTALADDAAEDPRVLAAMRREQRQLADDTW